MLDIADKEFEKMKWNIHNVPLDASCMDKFPEIRKLFMEFPMQFRTESINYEQIIRFIIFCYHRRSPFVEKLENVVERKVAILNYLQVPKKDNEWGQDVQRILKSADNKIAQMVYHFCKFEDSLTYFAYVTTVETYIMMNEKLGDAIDSAKDSKDTADVLVKLDKIEERIEKLADKLFRRDKDMKDHVASIIVLTGRKKKLLPEDYAD